MSDNYPRVQGDSWSAEDDFPWRTDATGDFKVVPADAIVIERSGLPEAQIDGNMLRVADLVWYPEAAYPHLHEHWANALAVLASVLYLREHPPVDEREVEALGRLFAEQNVLFPAKAREVARAILATGKVHVDTDGGA